MPKSRKNKIGIKEIASLAGVSIGTVDRVIHNRTGVNPETRKQVLAILEKYDYHPNVLASTLASHKTRRIAVLIPSHSQGNSFWQAPLKGIEQAEKEVHDYGLIIEKWFFDLFTPETFTQMATELIRTKPDAVLFAPLFSRESIMLIQSCDQASIPYVFIDTFLPNQNNLSYFGQDAYKSGYLAARLLDFGLPVSSAILLINLAGDAGNYNHLSQRENGFRNYFSDRGKMNKKIHAIEIPGKLEIELNVVIRTKLNKLPEIQGVFVTSNVERVARILDQFTGAKPVLIGYDLTDENLFYLQKGIIDFLIGQKPEQQGYDAIYCLYDHLVLNKKVKRSYFSPLDIITRENIPFFPDIENFRRT